MLENIQLGGCHSLLFFPIFFFNDTATTEIYTLSLHDALPICKCPGSRGKRRRALSAFPSRRFDMKEKRSKRDRKSTRLNSSHVRISYAVFCLKKKNTIKVRRVIGTKHKHNYTAYTDEPVQLEERNVKKPRRF